MTQDFTFDFEHKRHFECGRLYYVEKGGPSSQCPYCAWKRDNERSEERSRQYAKEIRLGRVVSGLRGALKRARTK